jgi:hypothetical protein
MIIGILITLFARLLYYAFKVTLPSKPANRIDLTTHSLQSLKLPLYIPKIGGNYCVKCGSLKHLSILELVERGYDSGTGKPLYDIHIKLSCPDDANNDNDYWLYLKYDSMNRSAEWRPYVHALSYI